VKKTLLVLLPLAALSGFFLSKASWLGRTGINLFFTEYKFLKVWWKGGLAVFCTWLVVLLLQYFFTHRSALKQSLIYFIASLLVCLGGLYLTYHDFTNNLSHKLLGWKFHTGAYLFWAGWLVIIALGYLEKKKQPIV
jgi:hypothetical protein